MIRTISEEEADRLINLQKWIEEDISWIEEEGYLKFKVKVECDEEYILFLIGVRNKVTGYCKFNLFIGSQPIRMLHFGKEHHNPTCDHIGRNHKHTYSDAYGEHLAYEPNDIDFSTINNAFYGFLRECNITLLGNYRTPTFQLGFL